MSVYLSVYPWCNDTPYKIGGGELIWSYWQKQTNRALRKKIQPTIKCIYLFWRLVLLHHKYELSDLLAVLKARKVFRRYFWILNKTSTYVFTLVFQKQ